MLKTAERGVGLVQCFVSPKRLFYKQLPQVTRLDFVSNVTAISQCGSPGFRVNGTSISHRVIPRLLCQDIFLHAVVQTRTPLHTALQSAGRRPARG